MAVKTTIKVALLTGAAKDDFFSTDTTSLTEDLLLAALNVLGSDPGSAQLYSLEQNLSGTGQMAQVNTSFSALGAMITINPDGTIAYDATNIEQTLTQMAEGEIKTDTFFYTVQMASGALSTAVVTLEIAGENDPPTLASIAPVDIHDTAANDTPAAVAGNLAGHDVDNGAILTYSLANMAGVDVSVPGVQTVQTSYGTLTLYTATGAYSFLADPDQIDALPAGTNMPVAFTVIVIDELGDASAAQDITFNLIGANDAAEITGTAAGTVREDGTQTAGGTLTVTDRDTGAAGFATATGLAGIYGDFTFNSSTGVWGYTLRNSDTNVQALASSDHPTDTLTVMSQDGSASQQITVTVNGANDAPTLAAPTVLQFTDTTANDPSSTQYATLAGSDIDNGAVLHYTLTNLSGVTASGHSQILTFAGNTLTLNTVTGAYSFQIGADYIDSIRLGSLASSTFGVQAVDAQGAHSATQTIRIEITGANDPATITGTASGSVTEDGGLTAGGTLTSDDLDDFSFDPPFQFVTAANLQGTYGDFTFNRTSGVWGYTLRNGDANVQALATADHPTDTLTVTSQDGTDTQVITVTVNGADEPAPPPPPPPPVDPVEIFNVTQVSFDEFQNYEITGFTNNDFIDFAGNINFIGDIEIDFITDPGNQVDSTSLLVTINNGSQSDPDLTAAVVILVGFIGFDPATDIVV